MIGWILVCVLAALTFYNSHWWSIGLALMLFWQISQWHRYKSRPWRRIHFPAMVLWSGASGLEAGHAQKENREHNFDKALHYFVKSLNPGMNLDDAPGFAQNAFSQYLAPQFESFIREKIVLKKASLSKPGADKVITNVTDKFTNPDIALKVRMIIAEAVKADAGQDEYIEYLRNVITDKAT